MSSSPPAALAASFTACIDDLTTKLVAIAAERGMPLSYATAARLTAEIWPYAVTEARHLLLFAKQPLTPAQRTVLDVIEQSYADRGYAPSMQEIADTCHYGSLATVHEHVLTLERKGWIARERGINRGILLIPPHPQRATDNDAS